MEKIELNLALLNELIEEYEMFEETFCSERDRQIFAMGTSVEYLKGDKPNMYRAELTHNYRIGNGHKLEEHIRGMRRTLEYADTSLTELRQECERVGHTVGAFGSGAFSNMKFMYNDSVKNEIVNCSNRIYNESRMLYQTLMEINSEIAPIVKEDFSSQIKSGRRQLDQIRDFMQAFIILTKRVMEKIAEIISRLRECAENETETQTQVQENNETEDIFKGNYQEWKKALAMRESSGDYSVVNRFGYMGLYQMGKMALEDCGMKDTDGKWTVEANYLGIFSDDDFLSSPMLQEKVFDKYYQRLLSYAKYYKFDDYTGKTMNGVTITKSGILGAMHLVGVGGIKKCLDQGDLNAVKDGNGVSAREYMELFGGYCLADN